MIIATDATGTSAIGGRDVRELNDGEPVEFTYDEDEGVRRARVNAEVGEFLAESEDYEVYVLKDERESADEDDESEDE